MTKKHFELIASAVREMNLPLADKEHVARTLAANLRTTNPNFNFDRFVAACLRV